MQGTALNLKNSIVKNSLYWWKKLHSGSHHLKTTGERICIVHSEMHIVLDRRMRPVYAKAAEEYLSPIQIKHATFIFITGRWQLLTQDAELIRKPVLYTAAGGINKKKNVKIGSVTSMKMDKQWRDTDRANWVADDSLVEQKESIQGGRQVLFLTSGSPDWYYLSFMTILLQQDVCGTHGANNL